MKNKLLFLQKKKKMLFSFKNVRNQSPLMDSISIYTILSFLFPPSFNLVPAPMLIFDPFSTIDYKYMTNPSVRIKTWLLTFHVLCMLLSNVWVLGPTVYCRLLTTISKSCLFKFFFGFCRKPKKSKSLTNKYNFLIFLLLNMI